MKPKIVPIGKIWKSEANGWVYHRGGVSPTICCGAHAGCQPKVEEHLINKDMAKIYKVIAIEFIRHDHSEGSGGTGYSQWEVVKVTLNDGKEVICNISNYYNDINESRRDLFGQLPPFSNIEEAYKLLGETLPWIADAPIEKVGTDFLKPKQERKKIYRIRKFTPRECFRLMGVSDADVDKIQAYPLIPQSDGIAIRPAGMTDAEVKKLKISESQQYRMAGNSIVVQVLEGIFTQMFKADSDSLF